MSWACFTLVDADSTDGWLYPVMSEQGQVEPIELEAEDTTVARWSVTDVELRATGKNGKFEKVGGLPDDLDWGVVLTDARLAVYCSKFDKGGGWRGFSAGGLAMAAAANAVSKARAANRRKGKLLVGHVRYPWVAQVLAQPRTGWLKPGRVRLMVDAGDGRSSDLLLVDLVVHKSVDALAMGHELAVRAARYRLKSGLGLDAETRAGFEAIARSGPAAHDPAVDNGWVEYICPNRFRVLSDVPRPAPSH
jgi:hypothetical protein